MQIRQLVNFVLLTAGTYFALTGTCAAEQVCDAFDAVVPMEIRASAEDVQKLLNQYSDASYLLFPEDRKFPIRMNDALPSRWVTAGPSLRFDGQANPGEFYTFQVGVYAARKPITDITVEYSDLKGPNGKVICASEFRCFNLGGVNCLGRPFTKVVSVAQGNVQPLWFGVQIPKDAQGRYEGTLTIEPKGLEPTKLKLFLTVSGPVLDDAGDSELWRHSRLRWLDSTIALDDEVTVPYTPLDVCGDTIQCLGRKVILNNMGLPKNIVSFFSPIVVGRIEGTGREILAGPISFVVETAGGCVDWSGGVVSFLSQKPSEVEWQSNSEGNVFLLNCRAVMEYDGHIAYRLSLKARRPTQVDDIRLEVPFKRGVAKYLMGMGHKGGCRPKGFFWKWDRKVHQDSVWIGDVCIGLQCKLKGPNCRRPLVNIHYRHGPLNIPPAWDNNGKGGCILSEIGNDVVLRAFSGPRTINAGEELHFYFDLLITPLKPIDIVKHWNTRYYHTGGAPPLSEIIEKGANAVIVHHGGAMNPYINYPFYREAVGKLTEFISRAHEKNLKAKLYYTSRELSKYVVEMWALRSLGNEIFSTVAEGKEIPKGPWGDDPWLKKHLRTNYIPAYRQRRKHKPDASILVTGMSRWNNYYLEGLKWLVDNVKIDGLYIDDVAYNRKIMQRARKILDRNRPGCLIDMHSWNHFNEGAGWINCAILYMELFPYIDSLWFGECFEPSETPDFWLVEMSGICFGLTSEMLWKDGNPWRGMVYGMTGRVPETQEPVHMWKVWDQFGIQDSEMIGYWVPNCPVRIDHKDILATVYKKKYKTIVSVASWAKKPVNVTLQIDFKALGLCRQKTRLYLPPIPDFQDEAVFSPTDAMLIQPGKGYLISIDECQLSAGDSSI